MPDALCCIASLVKISNLTTFQWVTSKKPPKSSLKLYLLLVSKHLKLVLDIYQLNTFNIAKMRVSVNGQVDGERSQKNTKKMP